MKTYFTLIYIFCYHISFAQNPLVKQWDYRFGGTGNDEIFCFQQTKDGGYILGGWSNSSIGGDKTQDTIGSNDFWIIKIDSIGNKQWDRTFGGTNWDGVNSLQQTIEGGYILGGSSQSGIGGDKTQPNWDTTGNTGDYWIVKTDSVGNKQWDKRFGGTDNEDLYSIQQTADGGYILGGTSSSTISGDKSQAANGTSDYWIIKIDSLGIKEWDKDFGGTNFDYLWSMQCTSDRGYILAGASASGISGDKTQATWGGDDYWIVKTDSFGNKQWDKDFGGTGSDYLSALRQTTDGGYILGGFSNSGMSGDKTQNTWGTPGDNDYWIVKIDSLGLKQWDKDFGGVDIEYQVGSITQTSDKGYLMAGKSRSGISGDKTENNLGQNQTWVIKTDSLGDKLWDKTLLVNGVVNYGFACQLKDGCYLMANYNNGVIGGDKTQNSWGLGYDYWIIKFCDTTLVASTNESGLFDRKFSLSPNPTSSSFTITTTTQLQNSQTEIYNLLGEKMYASPLNPPEAETKPISVLDWSAGIYFVKLQSEKGSAVQKLIVQ